MFKSKWEAYVRLSISLFCLCLAGSRLFSFSLCLSSFYTTVALPALSGFKSENNVLDNVNFCEIYSSYHPLSISPALISQLGLVPADRNLKFCVDYWFL